MPSQKQGKYNIEPNTEEKYKMISKTELWACWAQVVEVGEGGVCDPWGNKNEKNPRQGRKSEPGSPLETKAGFNYSYMIGNWERLQPPATEDFTLCEIYTYRETKM